MRILGIDIGSHTIKAVELESTFGGRFEIRDYHEIPLLNPASPQPDPLQTLSDFIKNLPKKPERIAMAIRTSHHTFRNLQIPAKAKKAIQAAIGFEMEDELPFASDQSIFDYTFVAQDKQTTQVHVAALLKRNLTSTLGPWLSINLDPDLLTTEAWAFRTLLNRIFDQKADELPSLLVHIGHERTVIYGHWKRAPFLAREIAWGGRDLTLAISKKYGIPLEEAERAKIDHGFVISPSQHEQATAEQIEFSNTLYQPIQHLIQELHQCILTCKNVTRLKAGLITVCGGTALLPGLPKLLETGLQTPVRPLQALNSISSSGVTYSEQTDANFALALSLALCLVGAERNTALNFRKGEFSKQLRSREFDKQLVRRIALGTSAVLSCLFLSLITQSIVYKKELKTVNIDLEKSVQSFFGQISSSAIKTYLNDTKQLRERMNSELTKQRELAKLTGPNPRSPLDFIKEISSSVSKEWVMDVTQFQVGAAPNGIYNPLAEQNVSITLLMANPQTADLLSEALSKKITGLQKSKVEETLAPDGTSKRWKVTLSGKPAEDAYGK